MRVCTLRNVGVFAFVAAGIWSTIAINTGCTPFSSNPQNDPVESTAVIAEPTLESPIVVAPDTISDRVIRADVSTILSSADSREMSLFIAPEDLAVQVVSPSETNGGSVFHVSLSLASAGSGDPCDTTTTPIEFVVSVNLDGTVTSVEPPRIPLDAGTIALLLAGEVSICTKIDANFFGSVDIATVNAAFPQTGLSNSNDNGAGNVNGNENSAGSSNDNVQVNGNDNNSFNSNDNEGAIGNANGNLNDNEVEDDDDNENASTGGNLNDNDSDDDDESNDNVDVLPGISNSSNSNMNDNSHDDSGGDDDDDDDDEDRNDNDDD